MAQSTGVEWVSSPGAKEPNTWEGFFFLHSLSEIKPFQSKCACRKQSMVLTRQHLLSCDASTESYKPERGQSRSPPDPPRLHPPHSQSQAFSSSALPPSPPLSHHALPPTAALSSALRSICVFSYGLLLPPGCHLAPQVPAHSESTLLSHSNLIKRWFQVLTLPSVFNRLSEPPPASAGLIHVTDF